MYKAGEYVYYANGGLCRVEEITKLNLSGADPDRLYYRLSPVAEHGSTIFAPIDTKVPMRRAMTHEEADRLIEAIPDMKPLRISEERGREQKYKDALMSTDAVQWASVIKTLYLRRKDRLAHGRKTTSTDERYLKTAQDRLYTELSLALDVCREDMETYILNKLS